jgi:hypothetical protein
VTGLAAALAWLLWFLLLLTGALVAIVAAGTLAVLVVAVPVGGGIRLRRGAWPHWYGPMLRLWLWALAIGVVFGGMTLVYWYGLR